MATAPWFGDTDISDLVRPAEGVPYWYGMGGVLCAWPKGGGTNLYNESSNVGFDCSGLVLRLLVLLGLVTPLCKVRRAADIVAQLCEPIALGEQRAGDVAAYKGSAGTIVHVRLVVAPPSKPGGHSMCIGADGGTSDTRGDDPGASVKFASGDYWSAFCGYYRVKPSTDVSLARVIGPALRQLAGDVRLGRPSEVVEAARSVLGGLVKRLYPSGVP